MSQRTENHTWTTRQRPILRLLYQHYNLSNEDVVKVFNYIVKNVLREQISEDGLPMQKLRNIHEKKGSHWRETYDLDRPNAKELEKREEFRGEMMVIIRQGLEDLGMGDVLSADDEGDESAVAGTRNGPADDDSDEIVVSPWRKKKSVDDEDDEIVVSPGIQNVPADDESDNIVVSPGTRKVPADDEGDEIEVSAETGHVSAVQSTANKDGLDAADKMFKGLHGSATKQPATKTADARRSARIASNNEEDANNAADQIAADQTAVVKSSKQSDKRTAISAPGSQTRNVSFAVPSSSSSPPARLRMQETRSQTNAAKASASKPVKKPLHGSLGASTDIDPDNSHDNDPPDDQIEPRLEMIHGGQCSWPAGLRYNGKHYVNHEHEIYKLGGTVRRCFVNGKEEDGKEEDAEQEDVMFCNEKYCLYCMDRTTKVTNYGDVGPEYHISAQAHAETNDLPFVHAKTCSVPHPGGGFHFKGVVPTSRGWGPAKYPVSTFTTNVTFRGRGGVLKRVKTTMCVHGQCVECAGQEAVDKKKARYEPGGDLYEKKMQVEEMKKQAEETKKQAEEMEMEMQAEEMETDGLDAESAG